MITLPHVNPMKMARCIRELERIYGIKSGGDRKSERHNVALKNQFTVAKSHNPNLPNQDKLPLLEFQALK